MSTHTGAPAVPAPLTLGVVTGAVVVAWLITGHVGALLIIVSVFGALGLLGVLGLSAYELALAHAYDLAALEQRGRTQPRARTRPERARPEITGVVDLDGSSGDAGMAPVQLDKITNGRRRS